jgi:cellulose biosynthesis protein BcsQ
MFSVPTIAIYSAKGGVGKTTLAVNLAWASATRSSRRTLLWDLDAQAAATFVLSRGTATIEAREVIEREVEPARAILPTAVPNLDLMPADASIRSLDAVFARIDRKKRLRRVLSDLSGDYDRILLDCPPGLGATSDQAIRAADMIVLPMIPSTLSRRAYEQVRAHLGMVHRKGPVILPVFTVADRRRSAHRAALLTEPEWPVIPMASAVEEMADRRKAIGEYAPRSPAAAALAGLWTEIERRLA